MFGDADASAGFGPVEAFFYAVSYSYKVLWWR